MKKSGFTLLEVIISLSIFTYVFSSLMLLFLQFSKNNTSHGKCSSTTFIYLQKIITEESLAVSTSSNEIIFESKTLIGDVSGLYLSNNKLDDCIVTLSKTTLATSTILNPLKCLSLKYINGTSDIICALM